MKPMVILTGPTAVGKTELKDGDTVKAGEVIKFKVTTKNVGERKLKNVTPESES